MGGYGSGRTSKVGRRPKTKRLVEQTPCLNSFKCMPGKLAKQNSMSCVSMGRFKLTISKRFLRIYSLQNDLILKTSMQTVDSGLGLRYYFTCPHCSIRTSRLYYSSTIGCRKYSNLSYHSQNISNEDRWLLRREKLLKRHGMSFENANSSIRKKGTHKITFKKFMAEYNFINDMGINIHLNRFDYKRVLTLLRNGKTENQYTHIHNDYVFQRFA